MKKKKVFIDLRYLKFINNGFGQQSLYYGRFLQENCEKFSDLEFTVLVPKKFVGAFGDGIKYMKVKKIYKLFPFLLPRFDICHSTTQQAKYFSLRPQTNRILTIHDLNYLYEKTPKQIEHRGGALQTYIDLSDKVTCISKFTADEIQKHLRVSTPPTVNYVGFPDIMNDPAVQPDYIKSDRKFFFTIGVVAVKKNFHVLLDMMKLLPQYDLYICGADTSDYAISIKNRIKDENISNVFVTGMISPEEKVWMYKYCHAFVFPSLFEGFGVPPIDAMRFGKAVFSSQETSLKEICDKYAYFWDNFEAEHMADVVNRNLEKFYESPDFIEAQKQYSLTFTCERYLSNYIQIYREMPVKTKGNILDHIKNYFKFVTGTYY